MPVLEGACCIEGPGGWVALFDGQGSYGGFVRLGDDRTISEGPVAKPWSDAAVGIQTAEVGRDLLTQWGAVFDTDGVLVGYAITWSKRWSLCDASDILHFQTNPPWDPAPDFCLRQQILVAGDVPHEDSPYLHCEHVCDDNNDHYDYNFETCPPPGSGFLDSGSQTSTQDASDVSMDCFTADIGTNDGSIKAQIILLSGHCAQTDQIIDILKKDAVLWSENRNGTKVLCRLLEMHPLIPAVVSIARDLLLALPSILYKKYTKHPIIAILIGGPPNERQDLWSHLLENLHEYITKNTVCLLEAALTKCGLWRGLVMARKLAQLDNLESIFSNNYFRNAADTTLRLLNESAIDEDVALGRQLRSRLLVDNSSRRGAQRACVGRVLKQRGTTL